MVRFIVAVVLTALQQAPAPAGTPSIVYQPPPDTIVIDGSKTPEKIPEWLVWSMTFSGLHIVHGMMERNPEGSLPSELRPMPTADLRLAFEEGARQIVREEECAKRQRPMQEAWIRATTDVDRERATTAIWNDVIECRTRDLEARDRLFEQLTPEGVLALSIYADGSRHRIVTTIGKADYAYYHLPR